MNPYGWTDVRYGTALRPVCPAVTSTLRSRSSGSPKAMESVHTTARPDRCSYMTSRWETSSALGAPGSRSSSRAAASRTDIPTSTPQSAAGRFTKLMTPALVQIDTVTEADSS